MSARSSKSIPNRRLLVGQPITDEVKGKVSPAHSISCVALSSGYLGLHVRKFHLTAVELMYTTSLDLLYPFIQPHKALNRLEYDTISEVEQRTYYDLPLHIRSSDSRHF